MEEKEKVPNSILTLVAGIVVTIVSIWFGQNNHLLPAQASEQAPLVDNFFNLMMTIGTALFLVVEGTIVIFAIKYRRRKGDEGDGAPVIGNLPLEAFWTAIPAIIVIGLGVYSVEVYRDMGGFDVTGHQTMMSHSHVSSPVATQHKGDAIAAPLIADTEGTNTELGTPETRKYGFGASPAEHGKPAAVTVNVTGIQYAWIFNYPDSGVSSGELHVPVGQSVQLNISAQDVIHSFWVPQFRLKQDALPGLPTELRFVATKVGDYPIVCAELCGGYHGSMRTRVIVHTPEEYETWLQENRVAQQQNPDRTLAVNPADLPESEFLAPYASEMGINDETLAQLHSKH